ncbi:MAG TPA: hypothetical protein VLM38_16240 [Blastocatellia bacterium]|nr:hypothetical protein [Blastocatellia bacterium]
MASTEPQEIIASEIKIVDRKGKLRMRLAVDEDGTAAVRFFDNGEQLRMALYPREPEDSDEQTLMEDREAGLVITERSPASVIRLAINDDGLLGKRPRLEIIEGVDIGRGRHRFPPLPRMLMTNPTLRLIVPSRLARESLRIVDESLLLRLKLERIVRPA